jgi:outer membrane protein TolC
MGLPANVPYDIDMPSDTTVLVGITDSVDTLIERAVRDRPDLEAARADARAAQAAVSVARSRLLPSLNVAGTDGLTYFSNSPVPGNGYTATLTLHIPIFAGGSDLYGMRAASAAAAATAAQVHGLEQQVIYQVFTSYYELRTATQRVRTSADLLASATASEQVALGRYRAGAGALLDLLTAQAALADARAQRIQARFTWYVALAQLAHDAGILGLDGTSPLHLHPDTTGTTR